MSQPHADATHDATVFDPDLFGSDHACFGCSPHHPIGFRLRFARQGDEVVTRFVPGEAYQGPPGIMHGGLATTLADEIGAWAIIGLLGKFGFTGSLRMKFVSPIRIGVEVEGRARIVRDMRRLVEVNVRITQKGELAVNGDFSFVLMNREGAEKLLGGPLPEAWERFCV